MKYGEGILKEHCFYRVAIQKCDVTAFHKIAIEQKYCW